MAEPGPKLLDFIVGLVEKRLVGGPPPLAVDLRRTPGTELPAVGRARHALIEGVSNYAVWLRSSPRLLLADTTLRAIQTSQLAGAVRTADLCEIVSHLTRTIPQVGVLDVASQETMERCLREAKECPFRRIEEIRREAPGMVLRATLSAATSFGAGVSPRSVLAVTAKELVRAGVEIIRAIDPFNDLDRLVAAVTAAGLAGAVVEGALCLDGALHPSLPGSESAAVAVATGLERHGAHVIVIEDRNGALRPVTAYTLVRAVRRAVGLPVWVRVVEAGGFGLATLLSAVEAGAVGVDVAMPAITGPGIDPSAVALTNALLDTERRPEVTPLALTTVDEVFRGYGARLGGWKGVAPVPPDAPDRGASPPVLAAVMEQIPAEQLVSPDQALAACEAAWRALGQPAAVSPARAAIVELALKMILTGEAGGSLLDQARVDDPQGRLDAVGSLRDGGFPEGTIAEVTPRGRRELLEQLWGEQATRFYAHQERFGELELIPGEIYLYGLGAGDHFDLLADGEPYKVRVKSVDRSVGKATVLLNDRQVELALLREDT